MLLLANIIIDCSALITTSLLYFNEKRDQSDHYSQSVFNRILICIIAYLFADALAWAVEGESFYGSCAVQTALNSVIYIAQFALSYLWLVYADYYINASVERVRKRQKIYIIPLLVEIVLILVNVKTGWIFGISEDNLYARGPFFGLSMIVFWGYGLYALFLTGRGFVSSKDKEQKRNCVWMAVFMFFPVLTSLSLFCGFYGVTVTPPSFSLSALMMYLNVHHRRLEEEKLKSVQAQTELTQSRMSIMLSQIQPHFLYNALGVIQRLCRTNPALAEQATIDFSMFLRGNMDSLTSDRPILFERELEHTRHYLSLELLRFPQTLHIIWDIGPTLFRLPTLTLQPIVENAVRYGVTKKEDGGTVRIATRETPLAFVISVTDDGMGYDPWQPKDDGRTHLGISNVRDRLARMMNGTLTIQSAPGQGTNVVITIPKENDEP